MDALERLEISVNLLRVAWRTGSEADVLAAAIDVEGASAKVRAEATIAWRAWLAEDSR